MGDMVKEGAGGMDDVEEEEVERMVDELWRGLGRRLSGGEERSKRWNGSNCSRALGVGWCAKHTVMSLYCKSGSFAGI